MISDIANRISDYKELQRLASLPSLVEVSFRDVHFGACPVCLLDGYRNSVLIWLKQLRVLDGVEVTSDDRESAQDAYLQKVFQFNQRVEELQREHEREMHSIEQRRKRIVAHSDVLSSEMMAAFDGLEDLISSGREQIAAEHKRQLRVRNENASALSAALAALGRLHAAEIDRRIAEEKQAAHDEERLLRVLEIRAHAEKTQAKIVAAMHYGDGSKETYEHVGACACALLSDHAPSFQILSRNFRQAQVFARHTDSNGRLLHILRAYQLLSSSSAEKFAEVAENNSNLSPRNAIQQRLYWSGSSSEQYNIIIRGFGEAKTSESDAGDRIILHSDPALALSLLPNDSNDIQHEALVSTTSTSNVGNDGSRSARSTDSGSSSPRRRLDASSSDIAPSNSTPLFTAAELGTVGLVLAVTCVVDTSAIEIVRLRNRPNTFEDLAPFFAQARDDSGLRNKVLEFRYDISIESQNTDPHTAADNEGNESRVAEEENRVLSQGSVWLFPSSLHHLLLPDVHILCASGPLGGDVRRIETVLDDLSRKQGVDVTTRSDVVTSSLLDQLEIRIEEEVFFLSESAELSIFALLPSFILLIDTPFAFSVGSAVSRTGVGRS